MVSIAGRRRNRIFARALPVEGVVRAVEAPLPHVPVHLVQAERIRGEGPHGSVARPSVVEVRPAAATLEQVYFDVMGVRPGANGESREGPEAGAAGAGERVA